MARPIRVIKDIESAIELEETRLYCRSPHIVIER